METDLSTTFSEPVASTSRAVFTLAYKPPTDAQDEDDEDMPDPLLLELYDEAWTAVNARIQTTLASLHDASLDQIVSFVDSSREVGTSLLATLTGRPPLRLGMIVGASPGSSSLLFTSLCRQLTAMPPPPEDAMEEEDEPAAPSRNPCIVSRLSSRDCSNIKSAMRSLIAGFIGSAPEVDYDSDEEEGYIASSGLKSAQLAPEDMQNLVAWYNFRYRRGGKASAPEPTLVILLEDLEGMEGKALTLLFETLSRYVSSLPLVFLLGIATSPEALYQVVPRTCTNLLDLGTFVVEPGIGAFNALLRGLFIDWEAPLALGPKPHAFLLKSFEDSHHSIDAAVSGIQFLYMSHFRTRFTAFLTLPPTPSTLAALPDTFLTTLRQLPSTSLLSTAVPGDDDAFLAIVEECRAKRSEWHARRRTALEALLLMQEFWEKRLPLEKTLLGLEEGTLEKHCDDLGVLVLRSEFNKFPRFLTTLLARLATVSTSPSTLSTELTTPQTRLTKLINSPRKGTRQNLLNDNVPGAAQAYAGMGMDQDDKEFSQIVREVKTVIVEEFRLAFQPSSTLPLHELWFTNEVTPLLRFHPSFQSSIQKSLLRADPTSTLNSSDDASDENDQVAIEDLAVAYRMYRETGKSINLSDWYGAFGDACFDEVKGAKRGRQQDAEEEEDEEEDEEENADRRKQARFLRTVGDLGYLGFLAPTTRKAEHVLKSVF